MEPVRGGGDGKRRAMPRIGMAPSFGGRLSRKSARAPGGAPQKSERAQFSRSRAQTMRTPTISLWLAPPVLVVFSSTRSPVIT